MLLKDYVVKRPSATRIQNGYVYEVVKSVYDTVRKYNIDSRKLIGRKQGQIFRRKICGKLTREMSLM